MPRPCSGIGREVAGQDVRDLTDGAASTPGPRSIADLRTQAFGLHQTKHAMATAHFARLSQVGGELAMTVDATAGDPVMLNQTDQAIILVRTLALWRTTPGVVAAPMGTKHPAHGGQTKLTDMVANERVLGPYPLAKYAAAFFKMSRSSVMRFNSAFRRRTSAL